MLPSDGRRLRCAVCRSWHGGEHDIDGVLVPSSRCADCAVDEWRARWSVGRVEDDPRMPTRRYRPRRLPAARFDRLTAAMDRREDLLR